MNCFNHRNFFMLLVILLLAISLQAQDYISEQTPEKQEKKGGFQPSRLFFGGDCGLNLGTYTVIDFDPLVGYRFTDKLSSGVQLDYSFIQISSMDVSTSIYGASVFATYMVYKNFFVKAEYQRLMLEARYFNPAASPTSSEHFGIDNIYVGGGIRTPITQRGYAYLFVLWNLNETIYNPYSNPDFGISFEF